MMTIGEMVFQYRKEHNLSQRQFALKCGLSNAYINMLEKNTNPCTGNPISISVETAGAIASAMGLNTSDLIRFADANTSTTEIQDNKLAIGQNIRKYRQLRGMSQAQLSEAIDRSISSIAMYETGQREPDMDTIETIAKVLHISNHDLIPDRNIFPYEDDTVRQMVTAMSRLSDPNRQKLISMARVVFPDAFPE